MEMFGQPNSLVLSDCLNYLEKCVGEGKTSFIDLVYIDPPFNSQQNYNIPFKYDSEVAEEAFKDTWSSVSYLDELEKVKEMNPSLFNFLQLLEVTKVPKSYIGYLTVMSIRCFLIREVLKDTGSFYYHCDPTMSHYIKMMLDYVFGVSSFKNEIVWRRTTHPGSSWKTISNQFGRDHDIILYYTKSDKYFFENPVRSWSDEEIRQKFPHDDFDGKGPYYWNTLCYYNKKMLKELDARGELKWSDGAKFPGYKFYLSKSKKGNLIGDFWIDIKPLESQSKERLDYPTQKPVELMDRIVLASSEEGSLVVDFFMGGGTTIVSALRHNRKFIGVDLNFRAIQITKKRIESEKRILKDDFFIYGVPKSSKELRDLVSKNLIGKSSSKFELEEVIVRYYLKGVTGHDKKVGDSSIDGRFYFKFEGRERTGLVQVTSSGGIGHLKAFCSEIGKGTGEVGVYVTFEDTITDGMRRECKSYGKVGHVDKVQILTIEELVGNGKQFEVPEDVLTFQ